MATSPRVIRTPGAAVEAAPAKAAEVLDGLPNAIDIDAATLLGPVLTRQGWVCPPDRTPQELAALRAKLEG